MIPFDLFKLLPGFHRARDGAAGGSLELLLGVLGTQLDALRANIELLEDCWFIETCPDWLVPYIADFVDIDEALTGAGNPELRALVANTVAYRRARGTLATLGHAATAASGWPVLAVDLDADMTRSRAPSGAGGRDAASGARRSLGTLRISGDDRAGGAFADADVLRSTTARLSGEGARFQRSAHIPAARPGMIGLFVWRQASHFQQDACPRRLRDGLATFHPLGVDMPLCTVAHRLPTSGSAATLDDMPRPLTRDLLATLLRRGGPLPFAIRLRQDGLWRALPSDRFIAADLRDAGASPSAQLPAADSVLVDPESGRFFLAEAAEAIAVDYASGATASVGAGVHGRADRMALPESTTWVARVDPSHAGPGAARPDGTWRFPSLAAALQGCPTTELDVLIEIADNDLHVLSSPRPDDGSDARCGLLDRSDSQRPALLCAGRSVAIQALDGFRPCVDARLLLDGGASAGRAVISGLFWRGAFAVEGGIELILLDCTVWPEAGPAVQGAGDPVAHRSLTMERCIAGPVHLPALNTALAIGSSIVDGRGGAALAGADGAAPGPFAVLTRSTLLGALHVIDEPERHDSLVTGDIVTPRARSRPVATATFRSLRLGQPGYAVLADDCPRAIARGAANGGELGAFHDSRDASRARAMARVVDDYLPEGLSGQFFFMT